MAKILIKRGPAGKVIVYGGASIDLIDWDRGAVGSDGKRTWPFARFTITFCVNGDGCYAGSGNTLIEAMAMAKSQRVYRRAERYAGVDYEALPTGR